MFRFQTLGWLLALAMLGPAACQPDPSPTSPPPQRATAPSPPTAGSAKQQRNATTASDPACAPGNDVHETSGCRCKTDRDCTCRFYDGEKFAERAEQSRCLDSGHCVQCLYD